MRQTKLKLSQKDRHTLEEFRAKGNHMARELNRAHILAALDRKIPENQIREVLGVGRTAIWRTRGAYLEGGLEFALRTSRVQASPSGTEPTRRRRWQPWPVRIRPQGPSAGRWRY